MKELSIPAAEPPRRRVEFPIIKSKHPGMGNITQEMIDQIELEDDLKRGGFMD